MKYLCKTTLNKKLKVAVGNKLGNPGTTIKYI